MIYFFKILFFRLARLVVFTPEVAIQIMEKNVEQFVEVNYLTIVLDFEVVYVFGWMIGLCVFDGMIWY